MIRALCSLVSLCALAAQAVAGTAFIDPIYGTAVTANIVYGTGLINEGAGSMNLNLDLYRPTDIGQGALPASSPGIVLVHGGGFTGGNKADMASMANLLSKYGYTVVSIQYRLFSTNPPLEPGAFDDPLSIPFSPPPPGFAWLPMPEGIDVVNAAVLDATKAIAWMKANAGTYNIDANHIALGGYSAGAITSLLQAYIDPDPVNHPQAVMAFAGSLYGSEVVIPPGVPPAFIVHGTVDTTVPFSGSQAVANKLTSLGVYNEFIVQTGVGHGLNPSYITDGKTTTQRQIEFLYNTLVVPEPSTLVLAGMGMMGAGLAMRRRRRGHKKTRNAACG